MPVRKNAVTRSVVLLVFALCLLSLVPSSVIMVVLTPNAVFSKSDKNLVNSSIKNSVKMQDMQTEKNSVLGI
jgi:hypothetical protein